MEPIDQEKSRIQSKNQEVNDIRVLIVDDQFFARQFLQKVLDPQSNSNLEIVGTASDGKQALHQMEFLQPDVVLIDIEMPEMNGITATRIIADKFPECKVLVLTSYDEGNYLQDAFQAGAKGYLLKNTPGKELRKAIAAVHNGYSQVGPGLLEKAFAERSELAIADPQSAEQPLDLSTDEEEEIGNRNWSSSTQELPNTLPRVWSRSLIYMLLIFTLIGLPWAIFAQIDETGSARGKIEPKGKTLRLDTAVSGKITEVDVKEGEKVEAGQTLLKIESEEVTSQLQQQQQELASLKDQLKSLASLKNQHLLAINSQGEQNQARIIEKQAQLEQASQSIQALRATYNSQKKEKQATIEQARKAIEVSKTISEAAKIRLASAMEKIPRYRQAFKDGAISQDRFLEVMQEAQEAQKALEKTKSELAQVESSLSEQQSIYETLIQSESAESEQAKLHLSEVQGSYNSLIPTNDLALINHQEKLEDAEARISDVEGEIAQIKSQIKSLKFQLQQYTVKAPVDGTIFQFPLNNAGATVQKGDTLAMIAQFNGMLYNQVKSDLVLRVKMPSSEAAFLKEGLPAKIKFDAYPFQDYGIVEGEVSWISPDSKTETEGQQTTQAEFFELEIELDQNYIENGVQEIPITPGQTATAEIIIRQRRLIDFFIEPFQKLRHGGLEL